MTAPSKPWTPITDSQVDIDSELYEPLFSIMKDNLVHLEEWLGDGYTAAKDHDHDGVNSKGGSALNIARTSEVLLFDDFLFYNLIGWEAAYAGVTSGTNGIVAILWNNIQSLPGFLYQGDVRPFKLETNNTIIFEAKMGFSGTPVTSNMYAIQLYNSSNNSIDFMKLTTGNALKWKCRTSNAGVVTTTETDIDVSASYQTLKIVATMTAVEFYIDGVLKATHTTNIPTVNLGIRALNGAITTEKVLVDYIYCYSNVRL